MAKKIIIVVVILLCLTPIALISNPGMSGIQKLVDGHREADWAPDLQFKLAKVYAWSFREKEAITCYEKFCLHFPEDPRVPEAQFLKAYYTEETGQGYTAIHLYQQFIDEYPDHPLAEKAEENVKTQFIVA